MCCLHLRAAPVRAQSKTPRATRSWGERGRPETPIVQAKFFRLPAAGPEPRHPNPSLQKSESPPTARLDRSTERAFGGEPGMVVQPAAPTNSCRGGWRVFLPQPLGLGQQKTTTGWAIVDKQAKALNFRTGEHKILPACTGGLHRGSPASPQGPSRGSAGRQAEPMSRRSQNEVVPSPPKPAREPDPACAFVRLCFPLATSRAQLSAHTGAHCGTARADACAAPVCLPRSCHTKSHQ